MTERAIPQNVTLYQRDLKTIRAVAEKLPDTGRKAANLSAALRAIIREFERMQRETEEEPHGNLVTVV